MPKRKVKFSFQFQLCNQTIIMKWRSFSLSVTVRKREQEIKTHFLQTDLPVITIGKYCDILSLTRNHTTTQKTVIQHFENHTAYRPSQHIVSFFWCCAICIVMMSTSISITSLVNYITFTLAEMQLFTQILDIGYSPGAMCGQMPS